MQSLNVVVHAEDNGSPALSAETTLEVTVVDVPDTAPIFNQSLYTVYLLDSALSVGDNILQIKAITPDERPPRYCLSPNDMFGIVSDSGIINSLSPSLSNGDYSLSVSATSGSCDDSDAATTTADILIIVGRAATPHLVQSTLYVSTFPHLLSSRHLLQLLTVSPNAGSSQYRLKLNPSVFSSDRYFSLDPSGELYISNTVLSGTHTLNVSIELDSQVWHDTVEVNVAFLSSNMMDGSIVLYLPLATVDQVVGYLLSPILSSMSELLSLSQHRLQLVGVQDNDEGTQIAFALLEPDLLSICCQRHLC